MEYLKDSFTVPVGSSKVSQDDWDEIFGKLEGRHLAALRKELEAENAVLQKELEEKIAAVQKELEEKIEKEE